MSTEPLAEPLTGVTEIGTSRSNEPVVAHGEIARNDAGHGLAEGDRIADAGGIGDRRRRRGPIDGHHVGIRLQDGIRLALEAAAERSRSSMTLKIESLLIRSS